MSIANRLVELRRNLIRGQVQGFDPNPASMLAMLQVNMLAYLKGFREPEFLKFSEELGRDQVL